MATQNYFTNYLASPGLGEKLEPGRNAADLIFIAGYTTVAAADDDTSTYLLIKGVPSSFRPVKALIECDAITSGTVFDFGLFNAATGVVADKDILASNVDLSTALKTIDGLSAVDLADLGALKSLAEIMSLTPQTAPAAYDIVMTGDTVGSAAGDVRYLLWGFAS